MGKGHFRIIPEHIINNKGETAVIAENEHWSIKGLPKQSFQIVKTEPPKKPSKRVQRAKDGEKMVYVTKVEVVNKTVVSMVNTDTGERGIPYMNGQDVSGKLTLEQFRARMRRGQITWNPINPGRELTPEEIRKYYPDLNKVSVTMQ